MKTHANEPPRIELAQLPSPCVELKNLARSADVPKIFLKRDDLSGLELSGNKIRKLEYVVADAIANGADTLVTHGGIQSNHCRATAAVGARLGVRVRMLLRGETPSVPYEGNLVLDKLFGAHCSYHPPDIYREQLDQLVKDAMQEEVDQGHKPYFFPVGASVPLGSWGYIRCVAELAETLGRDSAVDLYCATSSGGTQVGLILGRAILGCENWRVRGVPVSDSVEYFQTHLRDLERKTTEQFDLRLSIEQTPIELIDGFIGEGYAIEYPEAVETISLLGQTEAIVLDPSYTSKAMTAMLATLREESTDRIPVFIHTGGAFGLYGRRDLVGA